MNKLRRITLMLGVIGLMGGAPLLVKADDASDRADIDKEVNAAIANMYSSIPGSKELAAKSKGMLIFPSVVKAGFGIGAHYDEGALRVGGRSVGYYSTAAASFGLQAGAQSRSMAFLFMTNEALTQFKNSNGWNAGGDASVSVIKTGANGAVDLKTANQPIVAMVYGNTGLMADLSLEGTKVSKMDLSPSESSGSSGD